MELQILGPHGSVREIGHIDPGGDASIGHSGNHAFSTITGPSSNIFATPEISVMLRTLRKTPGRSLDCALFGVSCEPLNPSHGTRLSEPTPGIGTSSPRIKENGHSRGARTPGETIRVAPPSGAETDTAGRASPASGS